MTVCEKVPEMLLIIGPAIILGRHRGVPEPIITRRRKTVRKEEAWLSPARCPPRPPTPHRAGQGSQGKQLSGPPPGPSAFYSSSQHPNPPTPPFLHPFHKCPLNTFCVPGRMADGKTDRVPAHESPGHRPAITNKKSPLREQGHICSRRRDRKELGEAGAPMLRGGFSEEGTSALSAEG